MKYLAGPAHVERPVVYQQPIQLTPWGIVLLKQLIVGQMNKNSSPF
jgi:hypothetical protein